MKKIWRNNKQNIWLLVILIVAFIGILDSKYLTEAHFSNFTPPCDARFQFIDCGEVLKSKWSVVLGIPLALIGFIHYIVLSIFALLSMQTRKKIYRYFVLLLATIGAISSIYFMYLQIVPIGKICLYCTGSAFISFIIFLIASTSLRNERKELVVKLTEKLYHHILKPVFFIIDPETIHEAMVGTGRIFGFIKPITLGIEYLYRFKDEALNQEIAGIFFDNPIGLAAGFDYDSNLTQIMPSLGLGFMSVGTVTNMPYEGNPRPMLGRLPRSKSLMVNKGFKSKGASTISESLKNLTFDIPVGISIGRTNSSKLRTQKQSIQDIVSAFKKFESKNIKNSYYELNISCPNLIFGDITFYPLRNLKELLNEIDKLAIQKPIFIKMPITETNAHTMKMSEEIVKHNIHGVVIGNLQKNRNHSTLIRKEVDSFSKGNFSGKPTWDRSNELIQASYKRFGDELIIVGCGGVFSAQDAYKKIKLGSTLVQLITSMIYEGPQIFSQVNIELLDLVKKDGYKNVSDAIGVEA